MPGIESLKTIDPKSPAWLAAALRALDVDTWLAIQNAHSTYKGNSSKTQWSRCYLPDAELSKQGLTPETIFARKAVGLVAWESVGITYRLMDPVFDLVRTAVPPKTQLLSQLVKLPDAAIYLETPPGLLAPSGRITIGVLAYWAQSQNGQQQLVLMLNHGIDTSIHVIPDLGTLDDCLDNTTYQPSGRAIRPATANGLKEIVSLLLFACTYHNPVEEREALERHGHDKPVPLGARLLAGYIPMSTGRWLQSRGRNVFMIDPPSNSQAKHG